ncbi:MAG: RhuM family protein [Eubacteriales bacterium]|nr:RhuM family protein [Eubacteriales bacterium]
MKKKNALSEIRSSAAEYLTYTASVGGDADSMEMRYEDENIWLTQKMMAALYDVSVSAINQHLKTVFSDGELIEDSVIKKYLITAADGKKYSTKHYNLQAIIAVGFKVNNDRAVQFRKWAGQIVKDHTIQGWAKRLDGFLEFNGNELLTGAGKISAEQAKLHAETEFEKYRIIQDRLYESDFDRYLLNGE